MAVGRYPAATAGVPRTSDAERDGLCDAPVRLKIAAIQRPACPVETPPWEGCEDLRPHDVEQALQRGDLEASPIGPASPARHAARVAFLIRNGWHDPISIDVGVPWMPGWQPVWPIEDGNHRLYAAILMGRTEILAEIGGCLRTAADMFGK